MHDDSEVKKVRRKAGDDLSEKAERILDSIKQEIPSLKKEQGHLDLTELSEVTSSLHTI
jgi:hypothetical protein